MSVLALGPAEATGVRGVDPFDAMRGTRIPGWVKRNRIARQVTIQLRKRLPVDLAPLLGVKPFVMAKAAGSFLTATARAAGAADATPDPGRRAAAQVIADALHVAEGNLGDGAWGYEFDVQTRWAYYPAGAPNVVATSFVSHALLEAGVEFGRQDWLEEGRAAASFVRDRLLVREADRMWIRYTPDSDVLVHNASLLGASVLASAGALSGDADMVSEALDVARTSITAQSEDGRWEYGERVDLHWADNFHTAYDLLGLLGVWHATSDEGVLEAVRRGASYWAARFFDADGGPRYYDVKSRPYDIHCAATAVETAARLKEAGIDLIALARAVAGWTRSTLLAEDGATYYRRHRIWTDKRHFVRWGDGHWAVAEATLDSAERGGAGVPLATAVIEARRRWSTGR